MLYKAFTISILILSSILFSPIALGDSVSLNKQAYVFGDTIIISGKVSYSKDSFIGLQILNPSKSDIVVIDQFLPQKDGSFSKSYKAQGPKWVEDGIYTVRLAYLEQTFEKSFNFKGPEKQESQPETPISSNQQNVQSEKSTTNDKESLPNPKLKIKGFPDPEKPPNYYLERYAKDPEYRDWFNQTFPDYTLEGVVGYKQTQISGFPNNDNSPWFYVNRYNSEEVYRDWFDSQFPTKSIYDVLGYPESLFHKVPDWIKNNANWWSSGLITDSDFLTGIEYLINEKIIIIGSLPESGVSHGKTIPIWVKNTAKWWSEDQIDENEFLKGITFLIENGLISV